MIEPMILRDGERPTHAVVPWADWLRLRELLEDAADVADATLKLADTERDWIPAEVAQAIFDGGHPVRAWREHRGLTQSGLAAAARLPQPTVARIETGERKGTLTQMKALAAALGIALDTLVATLD